MLKISTIHFDINIVARLMREEYCDEDWITLFVDGVDLLKTNDFEPAYSFDVICKTLQGSGRYTIFNCTCGVPGCAGWYEGVKVSHFKDYIEWDVSDRSIKYCFDKYQHQDAIEKAKKQTQPVKSYEKWLAEDKAKDDPILWVIESGENYILEEFLEMGYVNTERATKKYAFKAIESSNVEGLEGIVDRFKSILTMKSEKGMTLLHEAVRENEVPCVEYLLSQGIDLHSCDSKGWTILDHALFEGHTNLAKYLSEKGIPKKTENERLSDVFS